MNGGILDPFPPSRGLKRGIPFPFTCLSFEMEMLGYLIEEECHNGKWKPVKASRRELASCVYSLQKNEKINAIYLFALILDKR